MTITEFLLARIAEDEQRARDLAAAYEADEVRPPARLISFYALVVPREVLAECKAKRAIVKIHGDDGRGDCTVCGSEIGYTFDYETNDETYNSDRHAAEFPCSTMRALASVYSDHPEFDPDWSS